MAPNALRFRVPSPSISIVASVLIFLFLALAALSSATGRVHSASGPNRVGPIAPAQSTPSIPGGWQRIEPYTDTFSIALPPGWAFVERQGIDSLVGEFVGDGIRLSFDYGAYSNPLAEPGDPGYSVSFERIDCKQAKIVEAVDAPARITGVYFGEVDRQRLRGFDWVTKLEINGSDLEPQERALVLQILRTIRFEQRCLSTGLGDWEIFDAPRSLTEVGWELPYLLGVDALAEDEVFAVGAMFSPDDPDFVGCSALRFDGSVWSAMECEANFPLTALDVVSLSAGWAGGFAEILSLDLDGWRKPEPSPGPFGFIRDLRMSSPERGRAVGQGFDIVYDEGQWSRGVSNMDGQALVLDGPDDGWAVGEEALYRLTGGQWSDPIDGGSIRLGGFGLALEGEAVWIGGQNPDSGLAEIIGYDPARGPFEAVEFAGSSHVRDLSLYPSGHGFGVGGNDEDGPAMIFERRGRLWTPYALPFDGELLDLDMRSERAGWAVGYREDEFSGGAIGVMLRYTGRGASQETPEPTISASLTPVPMTTTPAGPGPASPTPDLGSTGTPTPAGPFPTDEPADEGHLYLPMVVKHAMVSSSADRRLVVAMSFAPDTLYMHGGSGSTLNHVFAAIYDAPYDTLGYLPRPSMLAGLPGTGPGEGATVALVDVAPGERYVDAESGEVLEADALLEDVPQLTVEWRFGGMRRWEDGERVTMADSVFSRALECHPDSPTNKFLCERSADYRAIDGITLRWTGLPGFTPLGFETFFAPPLPRHQLGSDGRRMDEMEAAEILEDEVFARRPLANGPFRIARWIDDEIDDGVIEQAIVLERNSWYEDGGLGHSEERIDQPHLDHLIFRIIPDASAAMQALQGGAVDLVLPGILGLEDIDALHDAQAEGRLEPYLYTGRVWEQLSFNVDPLEGEAGAPTPFGACRALRHAVSMAIDRGTIVDVVNAGVGGGMEGIVPPEHWAVPELVVPPPDQLRFDPAGAEALLEDLGFVDGDGDGFREAFEDIECLISREDRDDTRHVIPQGTPLRLRYLTSQGNAIREETAQLMRHGLETVGIAVDVETVPANILFSDGPEGPLFGRWGFELGQFAWAATDVPDLVTYRCSEIPSSENDWSGRNLTGWCDAEYERESQALTWSLDRAAALDLARSAQDRWIEDRPAIPLYPRVQIAASRADLRGPMPDPSSASLLWNIETWRWGE